MSLSLAKDKIRFLLLEGVHPIAKQALNEAGYNTVTCCAEALNPDELSKQIRDIHFLGIRSRTQITPSILQHASKLTGIGCFCIGTNQVDTATAAACGIPVFNAPYANTRSVAELVLAEIIFLMRGIPRRNAAAHRGQWLKDAKASHEVRGKTLGIIGYGHIGSQLGILAEGLGMRVKYFDIESKLPLGNAQPVENIQTLLSSADVVSLHVPETPDTEFMINVDTLAMMKRGAHLINASRGRVVDITALKEALLTAQLASAALDVFPEEPATPQEPFVSELLGLDNVLMTPHIGGSTQEAQENIALDVAQKLVRYSDNGSTVGAVNFPEVALPDHSGTKRIMHIHRNEPGILNAVNSVISEATVNIAAQYLQTQADIGYVVMDIETEDASAIVNALSKIPATIKTRTLY